MLGLACPHPARWWEDNEWQSASPCKPAGRVAQQGTGLGRYHDPDRAPNSHPQVDLLRFEADHRIQSALRGTEEEENSLPWVNLKDNLLKGAFRNASENSANAKKVNITKGA